MRTPLQPSRASTTAAPARRAGAAVVLALMVCVSASATRRARAWAADSPPPTPSPAGSAAKPGAAASHAAAPAPSPLAESQPAAAPQADERAAVVSLLGQTIAWYRQLAIEERQATEPAETVFVDSDRQMALETLKLAFQYARAMAGLLKSEKPPAAASPARATAGGGPAKSDATAPSGLSALPARAQEQQNSLNQLKQQAAQLTAENVGAKAARRAELGRQLAMVQSQIELVQARLDSYNAIIQFQATTASGGNQGTGLPGQIDALERSVPQLNASVKSAAPALRGSPPAPAAGAPRVADESAPTPDNGLLGGIEALIKLGREHSALTGRIDDTRHLTTAIDAARTPLIARLRNLNANADALAAQPATDDLAANRARKQQFDDLIKRHKTIADALVPLAKQGVVLQLYVANLEQWTDAVDQRSDGQLRRLIIRFSVLGFLLLVVFIGSFIWRSLTFRYVQDLRRRRQLLQLRKLTVTLIVVLVLLFDFTSQLGTLATVMGLAAAGVALALQNVILSFAGYFFVTGRYGIRVGDRIQIAGISGDVIDIGLFKLALMELVGDGNSRQPSGRVVVFPNSIVFQANGNFFKQAPGTNFVWNEFRLTLAPDCDYRVAEKRLLEVVEDVYARYRDTVQRQYSDLERDLSMKFESPRPQSRLRLGSNGIELTIRYPADTRYAVQVADEISRRALDAITQDPALSLAMPGTPNLMPLSPPGPPVAGTAETGNGPDAAREPKSAAAAPMVPAEAEVIVEPPASDPPAPAAPRPRPPDKG